jgi:hypothetical protein
MGTTRPTSESCRSSSKTPTTTTGSTQDDTLHIAELRDALPSRDTVQVDNLTKRTSFTARHQLSARQTKDVLAGGLISRLAQEPQ